MKLSITSLAWIAGIYLSALFSPPLYALGLVATAGLLAAVAGRRLRILAWVAVCLVLAGGAMALAQVRDGDSTLQQYVNYEAVHVRGEIDREPSISGGLCRLSLAVKEVETGTGWEKVSGRVLVLTGAFPLLAQGDGVQFRGELQAIGAIKDAEYGLRLEQQGYSGVMNFPRRVDAVQRGWLHEFRGRLAKSLDSSLSEPQAGLSRALLVGMRAGISPELMASFSASGTTHIMAISGLHVAILGGMVMAAAGFLLGRHRPYYLFSALSVIWLYVALSGMRPPSVRAGIMFSIFLASQLVGRPGLAIPAVLMAAAVMTALDPALLWSVSFQMSFAAVSGVIVISPRLMALWDRRIGIKYEHTWWHEAVRPMAQMLAVGISASLAVYPLIAYYFGHVSLVGIPASFVSVLLLPAAIVMSLFTAVGGLLAAPLGAASGWFAWLFLGGIIKTAETFGSPSFAAVGFSPAAAGVWAYYALLGLAINHRVLARLCPAGMGEKVGALAGRLRNMTRSPPPKRLIVPLLVSLVLVWTAVASTPERHLTVTFLDIGQGDALLIQSPSGRQVLIDGGPDMAAISLALGKHMPFWDRSLDMVILTHPENDHMLGLIEVLQRYRVDYVLEAELETETVTYREWIRLLDEKGIEPVYARAGMVIDLGDGVLLEVIHPQERMLEGTESFLNSNSVVVRLWWEDISFLLTGDICKDAERAILFSGARVGSIVLKVPHHGSDTSAGEHFLAAVGAHVAVISAGADNPFGHPHQAVLERLEGMLVYRTDHHGCITFTTDGTRLWVETERGQTEAETILLPALAR